MSREKIQQREKRKRRIRAKISGTAQIPRLSVFKSNLHIYVQIIDDELGKTLVSASDLQIKKTAKKTKNQIAFQVGEKVAKKAKAKKIKKVVFDRGGFKFHGRIKAVADGARKTGLIF